MTPRMTLALLLNNRRSRTTEDGSPAATDASTEAGDMPLAVDVAEDAFAFTFTADVPGVQRSAVKVPYYPTPCIYLVSLHFFSCSCLKGK